MILIEIPAQQVTFRRTVKAEAYKMGKLNEKEITNLITGKREA